MVPTLSITGIQELELGRITRVNGVGG